jgi:hypothetical protein
MTIFCLRDNLYRDAAPVPFSSIIYREKDTAIYQTCTATAPERNKICTMTAKTRAIPSLPACGSQAGLHRDSLLAKVPGHCPVPSSGNTTSPYCRADIYDKSKKFLNYFQAWVSTT